IDEKTAGVGKAPCGEGKTLQNMRFAVPPVGFRAPPLTADLLGQQWLAR
ncbi:glycerol dehydrogenase, partial [Klebsiella pneumoniae]